MKPLHNLSAQKGIKASQPKPVSLHRTHLDLEVSDSVQTQIKVSHRVSLRIRSAARELDSPVGDSSELSMSRNRNLLRTSRAK